MHNIDTNRLFWFAWTARPDVHWISPVVAEGFFSCGNLLIFTCTGLYFTDCYGAQYAASAWSSCTFIRYLAAFAFPLYALPLLQNVLGGDADNSQLRSTDVRRPRSRLGNITSRIHSSRIGACSLCSRQVWRAPKEAKSIYSKRLALEDLSINFNDNTKPCSLQTSEQELKSMLTSNVRTGMSC